MTERLAAWFLVFVIVFFTVFFVNTMNQPAYRVTITIKEPPTTTTTSDGWTGQVAPEDLERPPG